MIMILVLAVHFQKEGAREWAPTRMDDVDLCCNFVRRLLTHVFCHKYTMNQCLLVCDMDYREKWIYFWLKCICPTCLSKFLITVWSHFFIPRNSLIAHWHHRCLTIFSLSWIWHFGIPRANKRVFWKGRCKNNEWKRRPIIMVQGLRGFTQQRC